jgi:hypothetical protein
MVQRRRTGAPTVNGAAPHGFRDGRQVKKIQCPHNNVFFLGTPYPSFFFTTELIMENSREKKRITSLPCGVLQFEETYLVSSTTYLFDIFLNFILHPLSIPLESYPPRVFSEPCNIFLFSLSLEKTGRCGEHRERSERCRRGGYSGMPPLKMRRRRPAVA